VLALVGLATFPVVVWTFYGFHYAPWPGETCAQPIAPELGLPGRVVAQLQRWRALPEAYLEGIRFQLEHARGGHAGYLMGESRTHGFRSYYLVALLVKNTPGFLLVIGVVLAFIVARVRHVLASRTELHWLLPVLAVLTASSFTSLQLGERYVLSVYPYLILLAAAAVPWAGTWRIAPGLLAVALVAHVVPSVLAAPGGYIPYFNFIAGGPEGGHRYLADSNLDWGQDLPRLAAWMKKKGLDRIQLAYFGADDADKYGIVHEDLPTWGATRPQSPAAQPFHGTAAISANLMTGFLFQLGEDPYAFLRGRAPDERVGVFFVYKFP
jgi:hypothetical protein